MEELLAQAREYLQAVLQRQGERLVPLVEFRLETGPYCDSPRAVATFADGRDWRWALPLGPFYNLDRRGADYFCRECERIFWRLYEEHQIEERLRPLRERVQRLAQTSTDCAVIVQAARELDLIEEQMRRRYHEAPMLVVDHGAFDEAAFSLLPGGVTFVEAPGRFYSTDWAAQAPRTTVELLQPPGGLDVIPGDYIREFRAWLDADLLGAMYGGQRAGAETKAMTLLNEWLTPAQRDQYRHDRSFEVIGSASGKRYRIRHGEAMNVDELDGKGRAVQGWCFAPEGYLAAGDVMLAQKIALETDERAALKKANPFIVDPWGGRYPGGVSFVASAEL